MKEVNKRFLKVMRTAIAEQWKGIDSKKDFADAIKILPQHLYVIEKNPSRNVTIEMIHNCYKVFGVRADYIINGIEPMRLSESKTIEARIKKLESLLK